MALYAARALACWLTLEWVTHTLWFNAVAKHKLWAALGTAEGRPLSPLDMALVPWWIMLFVWLKFLVIWRFFRCAIPPTPHSKGHPSCAPAPRTQG